MTTNERQVVLVTGASSGFGRLTAEALAARGHRVFAGLRDVRGRNARATAELSGQGLHVVELDVTDQASADRAIDEVVTAADRIDVVVNNAGMIFVGPLEAFSAEEAQRQFDVNALGALRVSRAALPHLRRQGRGALIQIGSIAGRVTLPYTGLYAASKAALAALTEALHHELAPLGVESTLVEPASYPTNIGLNAATPANPTALAPYGEHMGAYMAALTKRQTDNLGDPQVVADAVVALVETPAGQRPPRVVIAPEAQSEAVRTLNRTAADTAKVVAADMGVAPFLAA